MNMAEQRFSPLEGVRVLDFSRLLPGPYASALLVGMGAEVIKIEDMDKGDYIRDMIPELYFLVNRRKKAVAVDYKSPAGREIVFKLVAESDVVFESFRPGAMARWGLGYEDLKAVKKDIIYCSLSGFGSNSPIADRAGHDSQYVAESGLMGIVAMINEREYQSISPALADLGGGLNAVLAISSALFARERTGEGAYLDVALSDVPCSWAATSSNTKKGHKPEAAFNLYKTKDDEVLSMGNFEPHFWANFCKLVGREDLIGRAYDLTAIPIVGEIIRSKTAAEWSDLMENERICWAIATSPAGMHKNKQLKARGYVIEASDGTTILSPMLAFAQPCVPDSPSPEKGQNTEEILLSIGVSQEELQDLKQRGIVQTV